MSTFESKVSAALAHYFEALMAQAGLLKTLSYGQKKMQFSAASYR